MPEGVNNSDIPIVEEGLGVATERELTPQEKEIRGVWEAIQYVDRISKSKRVPLGEDVVKGIHSRVLRYYHPDAAGRYRDYEVAIRGAIFLPPHWSKVKELMWKFGIKAEERTRVLNHSLENVEGVVDAAAWAHYQLVQIHPFADGNGRTSRLVTDLIFKRGGLYYITQWGDPDEYVAALKQVDESGNLNFFSRFLADRLAQRYSEVLGKVNSAHLGNSGRSVVGSDLDDKRITLERISKNQGRRLEIVPL